MKDKNRIWTDCPECAYKHLTAAYAFRSACAEEAWPSVMETGTFVSRAVILAEEALDGYRGNRDLAIGCLGAAETVTEDPAVRSAIRRVRLMVMGKEDHDGAGVPEGLRRVNHTLPHYALAHVLEAVRECPALAGDFPTLTDGDLDTIGDAIEWIKTTYEIGGGENDER